MSNVNDLPQYSIDDIALEYNAEPPVIVTTQPLIAVGNVLTCSPPLPLIPVCVPANKYVITVPESQRASAQAFVNAKAQADLYNQTHFKIFNSVTLRTIPINGVSVSFPFNTSGLAGTVSKVVLVLNTLTCPDESGNLFMLLQSPSGQVAMVMGDAGCTNPCNVGFSIADGFPALPICPSSTPLSAGTFGPASGNNASLPAPAPAGPYTVAMSALNGSTPNGTWHLWAAQFVNPNPITLGNGFGMQITTV